MFRSRCERRRALVIMETSVLVKTNEVELERMQGGRESRYRRAGACLFKRTKVVYTSWNSTNTSQSRSDEDTPPISCMISRTE